MRILVADDHDLVRETIAAYLEKDNSMTVRQASSLDEALDAIKNEEGFALVLLDYAMPGMNGLAGLDAALRASDGRPVAMISGSANKAIAEQALQQGAAGFLPKTVAAKSMINAVKFMAMGEIYAPLDFMTQQETDNPATSHLSEREKQVLKGIAEGKSNKEIARDHDLQEVTVKLHVKTLYRKLQAKNRTHAAMIARDQNML
ncbi:DNA-binding response regulator, NarL/FixJ family, contains REC and HTH domains [Monaibacterium marinum]|uniref:DNA-binding response regulator, NarL/FixJ family, contains REC and HTH domains n=1 Tax=Pontivivens marinum TaxID=1690039 RepID=A0A2C9CSW6_9RHOB|nr:response regulator transcription factor [Monaibacterium marinum]SOH94352.1 DNA-binding response regulator, NarL/FixJ family, contains REC and HTH domains [Monaibacterium marinum]